MSWREELQDGSFRGAAFLIGESRAQFGRRNQVHEYPQRDMPWTEDLGRAARRWTVECLVIGDDYFSDRDALIAACEAKGAGTLVHPYLGTVQAILETPAEVSESTAEGGMARFSLSFVEPGMDIAPASTPDTQAQATAAATTLQAASATSVAANLDVLSQPAFVVSAAQGILSDASSTIGAALAAVQPLADGLTEIQQTVGSLAGDAADLLNDPATLVSAVYEAVGGVGVQATYADDALTQLSGPIGQGSTSTGAPAGLLGFGAAEPAVSQTTPSRIVQAQNQALLCQLVQCAAAAATVNTIADMDFTSYDDAVAIRDPVADQLDTLAVAIADNGDDDLARAVDDLRLAMIADVSARGASLARVYTYTPNTTEPAVVIAQRLYGDATQADDIIARNPSIQNAGFCSGPLEVLTDV